MEKKFSNPEVYSQVLRDLLHNDKDLSVSYKRAKIRYLLKFRWWNPFTWKYYFRFKEVKKKNGVC